MPVALKSVHGSSIVVCEYFWVLIISSDTDFCLKPCLVLPYYVTKLFSDSDSNEIIK